MNCKFVKFNTLLNFATTLYIIVLASYVLNCKWPKVLETYLELAV